MTPNSSPAVGLMAVLLAGLLPAQSPQPTTPAGRVALEAMAARGVPIHDEGTDARSGPLGIWAAGADYKCGFADEGIVLIPYLGDTAPRTLPWRWQTKSVHTGSEELLGATNEESHDDWRFERRRGQVTEIFDVRPEGVEQSFLIQKPSMAHNGALRIVGRVTSELTATARGPMCAPILFTTVDGSYQFSYGEAFAFDATGNGCKVPTSYEDGEITLHVPAEFVATAKWPLLVDPLLQPLVMISGSLIGFGELDVDAIDGDTPNRQLALVWSRSASATDSDIYVYRSAADFAGSVLFASEISAVVSSRECSIAGSWIDATMTVAWSRRTSTGVLCYARSFPASSASGSFANTVALPHLPGSNEWKPKVGCSKVLDMSPGHAMIVRLRETNGQTELVGTLFGTSNSQSYGWVRIASTDQSVGAIDEPSITKNIRGDYEAWIVAYQYWSTTSARWQVALQRINYTGTLSGTALTVVLGSPARHAMHPRVDGCLNRSLVAFSTAPISAYPGQLTVYTGTAVESVRADWSTSGGPPLHWPSTIVLTSSNRNLLVDSTVANTDNHSHWLVTTRQSATARVSLLGFRGIAVTHEIVPAPAGSGAHVAQDVMAAFSPHTGNYSVLASHTTNHQGVLSWRCAGMVRTYPDLPPTSLYGNSCSMQPPGRYGSFRVGCDRGLIAQGGLQQGQSVIAALSFGTSDIPLSIFGIAGGCSLLVDHSAPNFIGHFFLSANSGGVASIYLQLFEHLPSFDFYVQFLALGSTPGTVIASRGVLVPVR